MNRFFCLQAKSRRLQIYTVLMAISGLLSTIMQYRSRINVKTRTQMLYQYLSPLVKILKDTPDTPAGAYEAGYRFCYDYERPASRTASSIKRGNMAKETCYPRYI